MELRVCAALLLASFATAFASNSAASFSTLDPARLERGREAVAELERNAKTSSCFRDAFAE